MNSAAVRLVVYLVLLLIPLDAQGQSTAKPISATVQSTLATDAGQIRQFAFDGAADSYFASAKNAGAKDHFTLTFEQTVSMKSVAVTTGKPKGGDTLDSGDLEVSEDGKKFESIAKFAKGAAHAKLDGRKIKAIRVQPSEDLNHPLVIREFVVDSDPPVAVFKYPVEFKLDVSDAPEMKEWGEKAVRICEHEYAMINEELKSEGFKPLTVISMTLRKNYRGVAAAGGGRITGSVSYFKSHKDDFGAMVHETVHCVQWYRARNNPGWLVEGIADYIRFFKYEPGKLDELNPDRVKYNDSYRTSAAFLAYVSDKYDKELVRKLNKIMREGDYKEAVFKQLTKKTLMELDEEWRKSLRKDRTATEPLTGDRGGAARMRRTV